jgi:T-complex protein 1 subunit eta
MYVCSGGGEQFLEETDRSVHDALMIVKRALTGRSVVAGGGAIEMELSSVLRKYSRWVHRLRWV